LGLTTFLIGGAVLLLGLWLLRRYVTTDPKKLVQYGRQAGGAGLLAVSAYFAVRGNYMFGMIFAPIGLGLLKTGAWNAPFGWNAGPKATGQSSTVKSAALDMTLDHDTGDMQGKVTTGLFAGHMLSALSKDQLFALRSELWQDADSSALLEAYLDRRFAGWREHVDQNTDTRDRRPARSEAMTHEEAYQILGLQPGADVDAIKTAHRTLMKRMHPDQGGSTWLAAKVNEAKDILIRTHR
jgi:hypothetical protein